jgi:hypothetical protein
MSIDATTTQNDASMGVMVISFIMVDIDLHFMLISMILEIMYL